MSGQEIDDLTQENILSKWGSLDKPISILRTDEEDREKAAASLAQRFNLSIEKKPIWPGQKEGTLVLSVNLADENYQGPKNFGFFLEKLHEALQEAVQPQGILGRYGRLSDKDIPKRHELAGKYVDVPMLLSHRVIEKAKLERLVIACPELDRISTQYLDRILESFDQSKFPIFLVAGISEKFVLPTK